MWLIITLEGENIVDHYICILMNLLLFTYDVKNVYYKFCNELKFKNYVLNCIIIMKYIHSHKHNQPSLPDLRLGRG
jgi:hypothetical protein